MGNSRNPETPFPAEDNLQSLLANHPQLIPGRLIDPVNPRQWLLICREAGIPGEEDGGNRWALDHLFVDQDAVPTLVEVKRSSDTGSAARWSGRCWIMVPMRFHIGPSTGSAPYSSPYMG